MARRRSSRSTRRRSATRWETSARSRRRPAPAAMGATRTIAQATGARDAARDLVTRQRKRIDDVRRAVLNAEPVAVAAIEWLDPVFVAGHWTPQLVEPARGAAAPRFC